MAGSVLPVRLRLALIIVWIGIVLGGVALFMTRGDILRNEVLAMSSTSLALGSWVYLLLGCVRGFTLIPVTYLIPLGLVLLPPGLQFVLTLVGILISSASIYYFAEHLRLAEHFETHHARQLDRTRGLLLRQELPIVIGWSFFPFVPTDLICYVCGALRVDVRKLLAGVILGEGLTCAIYIFLGRQLVSFVLGARVPGTRPRDECVGRPRPRTSP